LLLTLTILPLIATAARAQLAASASITNDYRYRGASIGSDQPALTLNLSYDTTAFAGTDGYVGSAVTVGHLPYVGVQVFSQSEDIGLAGPMARGVTWDVGVSNTFLASYGDEQITHNFNPELYAGLKTKFISYYVYYSPHYFLDGVSALYAEADASVSPLEHWRLFAHTGALTPFAAGVLYYPRREQYDARIGVDRLFKGAELGLGWAFQRPGYGRFFPGAGRPDGLVATATCFF